MIHSNLQHIPIYNKNHDQCDVWQCTLNQLVKTKENTFKLHNFKRSLFFGVKLCALIISVIAVANILTLGLAGGILIHGLRESTVFLGIFVISSTNTVLFGRMMRSSEARYKKEIQELDKKIQIFRQKGYPIENI